MAARRARVRVAKLAKLPSGNQDSNDKEYEKLMEEMLPSMLYPHLDFADSQVRTDSGTLIRDLVFYNSRSHPFLNAEQTEAARLGQGRVFDPAAVVDDLHRDRIGFGSQHDIDSRGPGVPSYIRQRLLGGPEQDEAGLFRDRADRRDFDDPDGEPGNLAEIPRVLAERYRQRQVDQRIWLKIVGHPASRTHAVAEPLR